MITNGATWSCTHGNGGGPIIVANDTEAIT
jgi:hypothetical protein